MMTTVAEPLRRTRFLIVAVMLGHLVLISAQVATRSGSSLLEAILFGGFSHVQRAASHAVASVAHVWHGYFDLRGQRVENERLRAKVAELEKRVQEERALALRGERLQLLLGIKSAVPQRTLATSVIAADSTAWFRTITIDRGGADGIRKDMAVLSPRGVVGRVIDQPAAHASRVQLIVDRNAGVGSVIERTRAGGVIVGDGDGEMLRLEYVSGMADVKAGDVVVTSGLDGIYPRGYVIGRVTELNRTGQGFSAIRVQPAVDFSSLEELLVVLDAPAPPASASREAKR